MDLRFGTSPRQLSTLLFLLLAGCSGGGGSGGPSNDSTPPIVIRTIPAPDATNVPVDNVIKVTFSEAVNPSTISHETFFVSVEGGGDVAGVVSCSVETATFAPSAPLSPNTWYAATITAKVEDVVGNALASRYSWRFRTGPPTPAPLGIVTIRDGGVDSSNATLGIPRYKMVQSLSAPAKIWVIFSASGNDTYYSDNAGNSWLAIGRGGWEYHASVAADLSGNVHIADRIVDESGNSVIGVRYRRLRFPATSSAYFDNEMQFRDFGGAGGTGNVCTKGNEVFLFSRASFPSGPTPVVWHRSVDGGATFSSSGVVCTPASTFHRIGSAIVGDQVALFLWEFWTPCRITFYRWSGSSFVRDNAVLLQESDSEYTREFAATQDSDGNVHFVWWDYLPGAGPSLRHSYKSALTGDWSTPVTVDAWNNNDISPHITHRGNRIYVVYLFNDGRYTGVYTKTWTAANGWAAERTEVSTVGLGCRYPQVPQEVPITSAFIPVIWTQGGKILYRAIAVE